MYVRHLYCTLNIVLHLPDTPIKRVCVLQNQKQ